MAESNPPWCSRAVARWDRFRERFVDRRTYREGESVDARPDRPSRLTDIAVALLLAVADALALAGMSLWMVLGAMAHSEPPSGPVEPSHGVSFLAVALTWLIPGALAVSTFVHARLRMPVTATVQALFLLVGTVLAVGATNMLVSLA